jgi:hypothetical protein
MKNYFVRSAKIWTSQFSRAFLEYTLTVRGRLFNTAFNRHKLCTEQWPDSSRISRPVDQVIHEKRNTIHGSNNNNATSLHILCVFVQVTKIDNCKKSLESIIETKDMVDKMEATSTAEGT